MKNWSQLARKSASARPNRRSRQIEFAGLAAQIESLEHRACFVRERRSNLISTPTIDVEKSSASSAAGATGYTPSQLETAYGFDQVSLASVPTVRVKQLRSLTPITTPPSKAIFSL